MAIQINFSNKTFYLLVGILVLIGVAGVVIAIGAKPNPGHAISELQTCDEGETLKVVGGVWSCVDSTGGLGAQDYDSGWFSVTTITWTKDHNLGTFPVLVEVYWADNCNPSVIYRINDGDAYSYTSSSYKITNTQIIAKRSSYWGYDWTDAKSFGNGCMRVLAWK